jgi:Na+/H+ antiporter NhaA
MSTHTHTLPHPAVHHRETNPLVRLFRAALNRFLLLPLGALIALVWANTEPESYFRFAHALAFPVNEIAMAFFLALIAQELFEALMRGGALHTWQHRALPMVAALGGLIGAVATFQIYIGVAHQLSLARRRGRGHCRGVLRAAPDLPAPQRSRRVSPAAGGGD